MAKVPFRVTHTLTQQAASDRLLAGIPKLEKALPGGGTVVASRHGDDRMRLDIGLMGQTIVVDAVLTPEDVSGTVAVPMMLAMMKGQISDMVEDAITRMLAKAPSDA